MGSPAVPSIFQGIFLRFQGEKNTKPFELPNPRGQRSETRPQPRHIEPKVEEFFFGGVQKKTGGGVFNNESFVCI